MSIYATTLSVGDQDDEDPGVVVIRNTSDLRLGGRNDHPDPNTWPRGSISGAHIPSWCVPGHDAEKPFAVAAWYRLSIDHGHTFIDAVLDEHAVRALRDHLSAWLEEEKVYPRKATA